MTMTPIIKRVSEPTRRRKCPKCGSRTYTIERTASYLSQVVDGKVKYSRMARTDAGAFTCDNRECGYRETF